MTDFDRPYEIKEFIVMPEIINIRYCVLCHKSKKKMISTQMITSQDGIERNETINYVCMNCLDLLNASMDKKT